MHGAGPAALRHAFFYIPDSLYGRHQQPIAPLLQFIHYIDTVGGLVEERQEGGTGLLHLLDHLAITHWPRGQTPDLHDLRPDELVLFLLNEPIAITTHGGVLLLQSRELPGTLQRQHFYPRRVLPVQRCLPVLLTAKLGHDLVKRDIEGSVGIDGAHLAARRMTVPGERKPHRVALARAARLLLGNSHLYPRLLIQKTRETLQFVFDPLPQSWCDFHLSTFNDDLHRLLSFLNPTARHDQ